MTNVTNLNSLDEINRSMNNVTITLRLVWVDPAPSGSREHAIRTISSDRTRSIRLTLWGFDDQVKAQLLGALMGVIKWEGLTIRLHREPYLQREHLYGASCNREDKFNLRFVGRYTIVQPIVHGRCDFLDVVIPRPALTGSQVSVASSPNMTSQSIRHSQQGATTPDLREQSTNGNPAAATANRRPREWQCPNTGCRVSAWPYCMITGARHPPMCPLCNTQGIYRYCPATPRGSPPVLHEGVEPALPTVISLPTRSHAPWAQAESPQVREASTNMTAPVLTVPELEEELFSDT